MRAQTSRHFVLLDQAIFFILKKSLENNRGAWRRARQRHTERKLACVWGGGGKEGSHFKEIRGEVESKGEVRVTRVLTSDTSKVSSKVLTSATSPPLDIGKLIGRQSLVLPHTLSPHTLCLAFLSSILLPHVHRVATHRPAPPSSSPRATCAF